MVLGDSGRPDQGKRVLGEAVGLRALGLVEEVIWQTYRKINILNS